MSFLDSGYEILDGFLSSEQLDIFDNALVELNLPKSVGGIRNAEKKFECIKAFISSEQTLGQAAAYLEGAPKFVRALLFNKTPANNWLVTWHQDKTVVVSKDFTMHGWGPWSKKGGVLHVQPPLEVLNSMVTFRIHLDDSSAENGSLSVVSGSHKFGILSQQEISERAGSFKAILCHTSAGSALVMRPHLLHSSAKGTAPSQRRVLHIEYSSYELPSGVSWAANA